MCTQHFSLALSIILSKYRISVLFIVRLSFSLSMISLTASTPKSLSLNPLSVANFSWTHLDNVTDKTGNSSVDTHWITLNQFKFKSPDNNRKRDIISLRIHSMHALYSVVLANDTLLMVSLIYSVRLIADGSGQQLFENRGTARNIVAQKGFLQFLDFIDRYNYII